MTKTWGFIVISIQVVFSGSPVFAETRAFFTSKESVEQELIRLIDGSRSSIEMALFELRSAGLASALKRAQEKGVHLRLVLDASHREEDFPVGEVRWLGGKTSRGRSVMHNKFALFDQARVVTGSYNWTPGAEYSNYENALLTDDPETVGAYAREFETLWQRADQGSPPHPHPSRGWESLPAGRQGRLNGRVRQSLKHQRLKTIRIKVPKPVIKHRRKTHTSRP